MTNGTPTRNGNITVPITLALSIVASSVTGSITAVISAYNFKEKAAADISSAIKEDLKHMISREEYLEDRRITEAKQNQANYDLSVSLQRLQDKLDNLAETQAHYHG